MRRLCLRLTECYLIALPLASSHRSGATWSRCALTGKLLLRSADIVGRNRLDYNLDRFTIDDRKGLEIVIISSLFAVLQGDKLDEHTKDRPAVSPLGTPELPRPGVKRQPSDEVEAVSLAHVLSSSPIIASAGLRERDRHFQPPLRIGIRNALRSSVQCGHSTVSP